MSTVFSVTPCDDRWCVAADGKTLVTTRSAEAAWATAIEAVDILHRSGIEADLAELSAAPAEARRPAPPETD